MMWDSEAATWLYRGEEDPRLAHAWEAETASFAIGGGQVVGWMTPAEAARMLSVTVQTVTEWCRKGRIGCRRIGYRWSVSASDVAKMLRERQSVNASFDVERGSHG